MNLLLRGVWSFAETALRVPSSKCPRLSHYRCRGVAACQPCKTTQEVHVARSKCRSLRSVKFVIGNRHHGAADSESSNGNESRIFFFCGGYFKNSRRLSDINFKPVSWTKLPCCYICYKGSQVPVSSDVTVFSLTLFVNLQTAAVWSSETGYCHSLADRNVTMKHRVACKLDSAMTVATRRPVLCTQNRDSVPRRGRFFFSTESREGLGTAQSRSWHSYFFSSPIHTAYVHTYIHTYEILHVSE